MSSQKLNTFHFFIDQKHFGRTVCNQPQYCEVDYGVTNLSGHLFILPTHVKFNMWQLNYLPWSPTLSGEIRAAAIDHYNNTKDESEPFWDAEKDIIKSEKNK